MEEQKGRVGIAVVLAILLASAVVSWTVSAMAGDDGDSGGKVATPAPSPAAEIAPNRAYIDVKPGKGFEFDWEAVPPGVFTILGR